MSTDFSHLKAIPLFATLRDDELAYIGSIIRQTTYPAAQTIVRQGERGETFYIIVSGQVRVVRQDEAGAKATIRLLGPGQFFGEMGLLYGELTNATIETAVPTALLYIQRDDFHAMVARLPGVRQQLEQAAGRRSRMVGLGHFDWQMPDEIILWLARRSIWPQMFESLGGLIFWHGIAVALMVISGLDLPRIGYLSPTWQWSLRLAAMLILGLVWLWYIVDWTNDYLVLTNQRIVHFERYGIVRETRQEVPVVAVQNVILSRAGLLDVALNLGDITVDTIGGRLHFANITGAQYLQERILDQRTLAQLEARREEREAIRQELLKVLKPESLAEPPPPSPPSPDVLAALAQIKTSPSPRPSVRERLHLWYQVRTERGGEITWRKHWLILLKRLSGPILFGVVGIVVLVLVVRLWPSETPVSAWVALASLGILFPALVWGWWQFLVWGGDIYTLTPERIIDIERLPFGIRETRRESNLDRIQDIDVSIPNLLSRLFDMGDVYIKTGAAGSDLTFRSVARPHQVQRDIFHRLAAVRRKEQEIRRRQAMEEMTKWLSVYNELTTKL